MKLNYPLFDEFYYSKWIGKEVKKRSNKPFSSGELTDVVIGITENPYSGKSAFELKNSKLVDCFQCRLI